MLRSADGEALYRACDSQGHHHHLVCRRCGAAEEIAQAIEPYFPDTDLELLTAVTQRHKDIDAWNDTPIMKQSSFDKLQEIMEQAGELSARVPFDEVVDNSFGEKVTKE